MNEIVCVVKVSVFLAAEGEEGTGGQEAGPGCSQDSS